MARDEDSTEAPRLPPAPAWQSVGLGSLVEGRDSLPHALMLLGPRGHGKSLYARHLARHLLCEAPLARGGACGTCPSCHLVDVGQHPDLRILSPLEDEGADGESKRAEWITIAQVREVIEFVQLTTHRQRAKVVVVDPADRLNAEAANALLKTLEEPPAGTYLVLVTSRAGRLPATIRSRCRRLPCPVAAWDEATSWLRAAGVEEPALVLAQAGGAPFLALEVAEPSLQQWRTTLLRALADPGALDVGGAGARLDALPRVERRAQLQWTLHWLACWTADLACVRSGGPVRFSPDFAGALDRLAERTSLLALSRFFRAVLADAALASHPLSPRLVVERLLLRYRSLFR